MSSTSKEMKYHYKKNLKKKKSDEEALTKIKCFNI